MLKEKQDKVVAVGPKQVSQDCFSWQREREEKFYVTSTAYTANCNGCSGTTATGINLHANPNAKVIAVDPGLFHWEQRSMWKDMVMQLLQILAEQSKEIR